MAGDFNTDFNGDFSRVPYVASIAAPISFRASIEARHGVRASVAAQIPILASIAADFTESGTVTATLDARIQLTAALALARGASLALDATIKLNADIRAALPVVATLNAEVHLRADIRARQPRRRRQAPAGGGRRAGALFPVPPLPVLSKPYAPPAKVAIAATITLKARISAHFAALPTPALALPPALISGRLLAGLTLRARFSADVLFVDGDDEELIFMLAAAA